MIKAHLLFAICFLLSIATFSQELKIFRVGDFDLKGNVKTCQIITDYGQEIFGFDEQGRLVQVTTRYNEEDKDLTHYSYDDTGELVLKRVESYKNNELDLSSSMAHFYTIDTLSARKVEERIISYDKEYLEVQQYRYNEEGQLMTVTVSHENAVDEITIEYTEDGPQSCQTYFTNGMVRKTVEEWTKREDLELGKTAKRTTSFLDGEPDKAEEIITNESGQIISKQLLQYNREEGDFTLVKTHFYEYDSEGSLIKELNKKGNTTAEKEYIFQFDGSEYRNWVKKIVTPDNTYTTRKITYFPMPSVEEEEP